MNSYQLTLLIKNDLDEKTRKEVLDDVTRRFDKLVKEDLWGIKNMSYPIKHQDKAFYAHFEFEADPKKISPLDKSLKLNEEIVRYLLLRKD